MIGLAALVGPPESAELEGPKRGKRSPPMSISVLARQLMSQEIFRGLSPLQLTEIVRQADRIVYSPGDTIVEAGTASDAAVLIVTGDAVRFLDGESTLGLDAQSIGSGSLLS